MFFACSSGTVVGKSVSCPVCTAISIIRRMARPATTIERPPARAALASVRSRATFEAKVVAATARGASAITRSRFPTISASEPAAPSRNTFVESQVSASTPSAPRRSKTPMSMGSPSIGSGSSLKSPECTTSPDAVRIASPDASGIECVTGNHSTSKGPARTRSPAPTCLTAPMSSPASAMLRRTTSAVKGRA